MCNNHTPRYTTQPMPKPRGRKHTTLTQTAKAVVTLVQKQPGVKMIAPGQIASTRSKSKRITITYTRAGLELNISGTGIQKIAVHTTSAETTQTIADTIKTARSLQDFTISERFRIPGD